ncbi:MAG: hypothetical protein J0M12_14130, partial [Deltaproteobacteria bacterium]|nr:hypothetical protein [Deltaproteobacteria bacterium]
IRILSRHCCHCRWLRCFLFLAKGDRNVIQWSKDYQWILIGGLPRCVFGRNSSGADFPLAMTGATVSGEGSFVVAARI